MKNNIKYLFYPFTEQSYAIVKAMIQLNIKVDVIAAKGTGYVGKSIGYSMNRLEPKQIVKSLDEIDIEDYNALILPEDFKCIYYEDEIEILLKGVHKNQIEIYYCGNDTQLKEKLRDISIMEIDSTNLLLRHIERSKALNELPLFQSHVPIIYIGGLMETKDSFDIALQLKIKLEKQDYKCALVSQYRDGMLFGTFPYPAQFMGNKSTVEDQIISFNRWIEAIDYCYKPDLILIDVPKGMMQYSRSFHNSFGIYPQMMATTLPPDFLILTISKDNTDKEQLEKINQNFSQKLGKKVDVFHISNSMFNIQPNASSISEKPLLIREKKINMAINSLSDSLNYKFVNLTLNHEVEKLVEVLLSKFS